ncbi:phage protein NinX family protein [Pantoea sp. YU22]|uniref:phage protein NinX family protein n=1 Tax=Pantoea sp. YU22 TaxID=2497684 RepID=UPI0013152DDE|nr:phage protein NinX family protein [Pantoea sp. YU22]
MNYGEMSDVDIAVLVGKHVSKDGQSLVGITGKACIHEYAPSVGNFGEMCLGWREFDPCNSWAEAGPIILANKITISAPMEYDQPYEWLAYPSSDSDICVSHPNPLRAAMTAFLMMQEQSNA